MQFRVFTSRPPCPHHHPFPFLSVPFHPLVRHKRRRTFAVPPLQLVGYCNKAFYDLRCLTHLLFLWQLSYFAYDTFDRCQAPSAAVNAAVKRSPSRSLLFPASPPPLTLTTHSWVMPPFLHETKLILWFGTKRKIYLIEFLKSTLLIRSINSLILDFMKLKL